MNNQEFLTELINHHEKVSEARAALNSALKGQSDSWKAIAGDLFGGRVSLSQRVIVKSGGKLYEIEFDVDDWNVPTIKRAENWTEFHELSEVSQ